jgi:hypothetical protein
MSISFRGTLTEPQFNRFQKHCAPLILRLILKWFPWCWLGFALVKVFAIDSYLTSFWVVFDLCFILYFLLFIPYLQKSQVKKAWQSNRLLREEIFGTVDRNGIIWRHAYGEMRFPWELILSYREVADIMLLYTSINQAILLPRDFFSAEADWLQFKQLIAENLPQKKN